MEREQTSASPIYVANSGAVGQSKYRRSCQRSRHYLDRRDRKVREYVAHDCLEVHKIDASENVVEVLTNSLPVHVHHKHVDTACKLWSSRGQQAASRTRDHCPLHDLCLLSTILALGTSHAARGVLIDPLQFSQILHWKYRKLLIQ
eukprot:5488544-Pleurochrysis_carterae.AAC.2